MISCNDSKAARTAISDHGVDAVIADVRLSAINMRESIDFIQFVRSRYSDLPVIMMSGTEDLKTEAMEEGADYFLQKPVDVDALMDLLHDLGLEVGASNV